MKGLANFTASRYNNRLIRYVRGDSYSWIPLSVFQPLLWISRISDNNYWPAGYWVRHPNSNFFVLEMVLEGALQISTEGKTSVISAGDAVLLPPGPVKLSAGSSRPCLKRYLIFTGQISSLFQHTQHLDCIHVLPDFNSPEFEGMFRRVMEIHSRQNPEEARELSVLAFSILLYTISKQQSSFLPEELLACKEYIESNIAQPISLDDIAMVAKCSKSTLKWQYAKYLNTSPGHNLTEIRLRYALQLLENDHLLLKQIAGLCGYANPLYFSNVFKNYFGCSPRQYRKTHTLPKPLSPAST